jgi:starvation-inducible DNA-binding protein
VDAIAERVQLVGGVSLAMAHDAAETTLIPVRRKARASPGAGRRLAARAEIVLKESRTMARKAAEHDDQGW